ncbi:MAG TPA: hypothetical protein VFQ83_04980 [Candidatus Udaeobacter sp.]|nr:hypothetical protein [Candidatus Udaeobacter sp.]
MAFVLWNDFGPNLSLMQSFAMGNNFPTEYPHFIGEPIRYHFLFWFQAGNLEFLGLNLAWALNLLSVFCLVAMLLLIMTLGEVLFKSRVVGRIAASLFFFPTTLSYVPFLQSQHSLSQGFKSILALNHWLVSGYPYKAENVGTWSLSIFYVQRHLVVGIGILLFVLTFLVIFLQAHSKKRPTTDEANASEESPTKDTVSPAAAALSQATVSPIEELPELDKRSQTQFASFIFTGALLGLLPLWNSASFVAAFALVSGMFLLFPHRGRLLSLLITATAVALPQIAFLFLRKHGFAHGNSIFHWGLVVENPTIIRVLSYFSFTFGTKLLLGLAAILFCLAFPRRLFVAMLILPLLAFSTQLSTDIINNHKFLYIWVLLLNIFVAYTIWQVGKVHWIGKPAAIALLLVITLGGAIEWFRIHNDTIVDVPFKRNPLSDWLQTQTSPKDIFLTDRLVIHPILLNGRRIFYGWPYFGWSMGYPTGTRDALYEKMFTEKDPTKLVHLLNENDISYVAIDNALRSGFLKGKLNEAIYRRLFKVVFQDKENRFGALTIYQVPEPTTTHRS